MIQVTKVIDQSVAAMPAMTKPPFTRESATPLLALLFGLMVVLTTSCTSTGGGVKAGLIDPVINVRQASANENGGYQPPRSPGFSQFGS